MAASGDTNMDIEGAIVNTFGLGTYQAPVVNLNQPIPND